jgi:hypothetical protein
MRTIGILVVLCTLGCSGTERPATADTQAVQEANAKIEQTANRAKYEPQAGDRVKLTGLFKTTKGYMGVVKGILLPHFVNQEEEALKYKGKRVEVIGTLAKPQYPEGKEVQRWLGLQLELESINIVTDGDQAEETVEKLSAVEERR